MTDRYKEAACAIGALKHVREELQPGVIAVHDQLSFPIIIVLRLDLREPRVLCRKGGRRV